MKYFLIISMIMFGQTTSENRIGPLNKEECRSSAIKLYDHWNNGNLNIDMQVAKDLGSTLKLKCVSIEEDLFND